MISISRTRSENRNATIKRRQQQVLSEQAEAARELSENTARLKALRLAREAKSASETPAKKIRVKKLNTRK
jgi:hypothetical protein